MPTPMPMANSREAPRFSSDPSGFDSFFEDVQELADRAGIDHQSTIKWACRYAGSESDSWKHLQSFKDSDWTKFKKEVRQGYPQLDEDRRYTHHDLQVVAESARSYRNMSRADLGTYYRRFLACSSYLIGRNRLSVREQSSMYLDGFPQPVGAAILERLRIVAPTVIPTEGYDFKDIHEAALFVLAAGFADSTTPGVTGSSARLPAPTSGAPSDPRLESLIQVVSDLTRAVSANVSGHQPSSTLPPGRFPPQVSAPGGAFQNPAQWGPPQRNFSNDCVFCSSLQHLIRDCPTAAEYLKQGKIIRNNYGRLVLPHGYSPPRDTPGRNMKERIDHVWRAEGIQGKDTPKHDSVSANFLESPDECVFSFDASPTYSGNENPTYDEQLQIMQAQIHSLLDAQALAVQGKRERFDGVEIPRRTGPPNHQRRLPQPQNSQQPNSQPSSSQQQPPQPNIHARGARAGNPPQNPREQPRDRSANDQYRDNPPHILQRSQGPMKPINMPPKPAPEEPKYKYQSAIETSIKTSDLVERALDAKVTLSTRELLATSPEIRRHVKDLVASKKVSANLVEEEQVDSYLNTCFEEEQASSFYDAERYNPQSPSAVPSLPLRVIFPTFANGVEPECILDGGAQVVVMRRDVWEKLRSPITSSKAMSMESANSTRAMTLGLIENQPVKLGPVTIYLQIQVVDNAPFEVLLGRPFFDVTSCSEISRSGGNHEIHIKDPKTGVSYAFPTEPRQRRPRAKMEPAVNFRE